MGLALPLEVLGDADHVVPALRGLGDQVTAVPEQLHVGVLRRSVELALVPGGVQRARQGALLHLALVLTGPLPDPLRAGELLGPGDVEAEHVHPGVLGGQPADQLHPLVVGLPGQHPVGDLVAALGPGVAVVDHLLQVLLGWVVQVDRGRTSVAVVSAACGQRRDQRQRGCRRPGPERRPTPVPGRSGVRHRSPPLFGEYRGSHPRPGARRAGTGPVKCGNAPARPFRAPTLPDL